MAVLLLRLAAPLQAWGSGSKFDIRSTEREPTKSGVVGMIAAALGIQRNSGDKKLSELNSLKFGVRVEREGKLLKDFHMVHSEKASYVTERYYLSDAVFIAALESSDKELLERIGYALNNPVYPLFLGRRSCPPTLPVVIGIREGELEETLEKEPSLAGCTDVNRRIVTDAKAGGSVVQDVPVSFSQLHRRHGFRMKKEKTVKIELAAHDPFREL